MKRSFLVEIKRVAVEIKQKKELMKKKKIICSEYYKEHGQGMCRIDGKRCKQELDTPDLRKRRATVGIVVSVIALLAMAFIAFFK